MTQFKIIKNCLVVLFSVVLATKTHAQDVQANQTPRTIGELRSAILYVLEETKTPAAGIALVNREGPVWVEGLGLANKEKGMEADEETMFRIGSTSKIVVALAILKLQEEGKLSLKDRVRDLAPEIEFENAWEDTHPVRVEHLLEHTTGWDDIHLAEAAFNEPELISLKEGLDYHPHSRISRWVPGTRMAYANSGPAVAAYLIEKITGQAYEAYIQEIFFTPMDMESMTYFLSEKYKQKGATLYKEGFPQKYWHLIMRPSGAINASPKDMAKMLQFFIQRGKLMSGPLISESSLKRMETPSTTSGARAGLAYGYGLGLYSSDHKGFTYYKHGGGIGGGVSDFSYLPAYGLGYSVQINAGNPQAIRKISKLIRDFQTHQLPKPVKVNTILKSRGEVRAVSGYYQPINPRNSLPFYLPPVMARRIWTEGDTLCSQLPAHLGEIVKFVAVDKGLYHNLHTDRPDFVVVNDPLEGEVLELSGREGGTLTLGSVPGALLFGRIGLLILWLILIIRAAVLMPFWVFAYWKGRISGGAQVLVRVWPLVPLAFLLTAFGLFAFGAMDGTAVLAKPGILSVSLMAATIGFFVAAVSSLLLVILHRNKGIKRSVFLPATLLAVLHTLLAFYFLWHGVIGLRTWA